MWSSAGARIGEHPLVSTFIQSLMNDDMTNRGRRRYWYDDTWDVQCVFDHVQTVLDSPAFMELHDNPRRHCAYVTQLRDLIIPLARILLCSRSSDLACVYWGLSSDAECIRFHFDSADIDRLTAVDFRFYAPKQRCCMPTTHHGYID
jgi:hypothetical protein